MIISAVLGQDICNSHGYKCTHTNIRIFFPDVWNLWNIESLINEKKVCSKVKMIDGLIHMYYVYT